jgi:acetoin utilization protein AcuB
VLVGIVSERDIRAQFPMLPPLDEQLEAWARRLDEPIAQAMNRHVFSVEVETDVADLVDLMIEHRVGAIPVVDQTGGKLVGIVSYVDVLRELRRSLWG